ncbi:MAG: hypothetical protein ACP5OU_09820, partial [Methanothrix sp.]
LSPNYQDTAVNDRINANRPPSRIHCEALYQKLRIDILRLPTGNSEEPDNYLPPNTFDVLPRRKKITIFNRQAAGSSSTSSTTVRSSRSWPTTTTRTSYGFEFKTVGERNKALKPQEMRGFDVELVEDLKGYVIKLPRYSKYALVLKNSVAMIETQEWHIFRMKDLAAMEEAQRQGAKIVEVDVKF